MGRQKLILLFFVAISWTTCRIETDIKQIDDFKTDSKNTRDSSYLGQTLSEVVRELDLDTNQFLTFDEPPFILRGIHINSPNHNMTLWVERTSIVDKTYLTSRQKYIYIKDKKVIAVTRTSK